MSQVLFVQNNHVQQIPLQIKSFLFNGFPKESSRLWKNSSTTLCERPKNSSLKLKNYFFKPLQNKKPFRNVYCETHKEAQTEITVQQNVLKPRAEPVE